MILRDRVGRESRQLTAGSPWASDTLTNTYTRGRRTALLLQQPAGSWTNAFGYDTAGRLTNVTSPAGVFGYLYPASGVRHQVSRLLLPSGAYITNDCDSVGRLLFTKLLTSGGVVTNAHSYDYNVASQRLRGTLGEGSSYSYSYDPIGQLSHARFTNALGQSVSGLGRDYAYDAAWNLAWRTNGGAAQQFVLNPMNELTNSTPTVAQTYDANGNLLTREQGQWTYSYDDANQLRWLVKSNASLPEAWTELVYDGLGRLRVRREYAWIGYVEPDDPDLNAAMEVLSAMVESSSGGHWYLSNEVCEHRYGLIPVVRKCWTLRGVRPIGPYQTRYEWGYRYSALEVDGENAAEFLCLPRVDLGLSRLFLEQLVARDQAEHVVIQDRAGFHSDPELHELPAQVHIIPLPACSPELNPTEAIGDVIKDRIANTLWKTWDALEEAIGEELRPIYQCAERVRRLVSHGWLLDQVNATAVENSAVA
jgi:YD repeat-containing protein